MILHVLSTYASHCTLVIVARVCGSLHNNVFNNDKTLSDTPLVVVVVLEPTLQCTYDCQFASLNQYCHLLAKETLVVVAVAVAMIEVVAVTLVVVTIQ